MLSTALEKAIDRAYHSAQSANHEFLTLEHLLLSLLDERSVTDALLSFGADLARLHFIRHARAVGFSLQQIATLLRLQENPTRHASEVKALTAAHIATLRAQIGDLQAMVAQLQRWHDACHGDDTPACAILDGLQQDEPQGCD